MASVKEVRAVAQLCKLHINPDREAQLTQEFNAIVAFANTLEAVDVNGVEPMCAVHGAVNVFRSDETRPSLDPDAILATAPDSSAQCFRVPLVIESEDS